MKQEAVVNKFTTLSATYSTTDLSEGMVAYKRRGELHTRHTAGRKSLWKLPLTFRQYLS